VQGFDSMPVVAPFNRSELYEIWIRQSLFNDKLIIRVGKSIPTYDFNNVIRPVPVQDATLNIPGVSGLLYTPIFINPVNIGVMPGYYNSAYGVTVNIAPVNNYYISLGAYDGNLARGVQTGKLSIPDVVEQDGTEGFYLFGSQRAWFCRPEIDDSGISLFWQFGHNYAKTLPMNTFLGAGFTAFALTRPGCVE